MKIEVVKNAKRNIVFGVVNKLILLMCPFIERTVIRYVLGAEYLGLNSLFSSVISVLGLSELGFNTAIVYNMYKPIAEDDTSLVNAWLFLYRKAYRIVGMAILSMGLLLLPFLDKLISAGHPSDVNIYLLYIIFLFNAVISYFLFSYMSSIIIVHQRDDLISTRNTVVKLLLTGAQLVALFATKNYYCFVLLMPVFTILNNLWIAGVSHRYFPQYKCEGKVPPEKLKGIKKLLTGTFIQKACDVTRDSLDSICTSAFLGLTMTAVYNNYFTVSNAVTKLLIVFSTALLGGVGNHVATKTPSENFDELKKADFVYLWIAGWAATCLLCLYQPFMEIWMKENMLLPLPAVIMFCVYFYIRKLGDLRGMYNNASGIWWEHRWRAIIETICNLLLNIVLGKYFGVYGIISATVISLLTCNYLWGTRITFKLYFKERKYLKEYYLYQARYTLITIAVCMLTFFVCRMFSTSNLFISLMIRAIICLILPNLVYFVIYRNSNLFTYALSVIKSGSKRGLKS